jgi:hypothetical protein
MSAFHLIFERLGGHDMKQTMFTALALVTAVPLATMMGGVAIAQTSDCESQITSLRTATETVTITGKNADKDRAGLLGKIDAASADLSAGKNAGAVQKLTNYRTKVEQLAASGHVTSTDATSLISQVDSAIACINPATG